MRIGPQEHLQTVACAMPPGNVHRRDAGSRPPMRLVAQRRHQQMRLVTDRLPARRDRVVPRRQRPQQRRQLFRRQRLGRQRQQIHDLPPHRPVRRRCLDPGLAGKIFDLLAGQCRDVQPVDQRPTQGGVPAQPRRLQHRIGQRRIVRRHHPQRVARLIQNARSFQRDRHMVCVRSRSRPGQSHVVGHLRLERPRPCRHIRPRPSEIDMNDGGANLLDPNLGIQPLEQSLDPGRRRRLVVQVALDPVDHPSAAQRREAFVDPPPDFAELRIRPVTQRQHRKPGLLEPGRIVCHQRLVEVDRPLGRIAFTPGRGDHQQVLRRCRIRHGKIRHVDDPGRESQLRRNLTGLPGQRLGVARTRCRRGLSAAPAWPGAPPAPPRPDRSPPAAQPDTLTATPAALPSSPRSPDLTPQSAPARTVRCQAVGGRSACCVPHPARRNRENPSNGPASIGQTAQARAPKEDILPKSARAAAEN